MPDTDGTGETAQRKAAEDGPAVPDGQGRSCGEWAKKPQTGEAGRVVGLVLRDSSSGKLTCRPRAAAGPSRLAGAAEASG